jgi:hypothetical protein
VSGAGRAGDVACARAVSGGEALGGLIGRSDERVVWEGDEVERVSVIVADLDECSLVVGLDDGPDRAGRPTAGIDEQFDDVEHSVSS